MMFSNFFKILSILLAIAVIVEKVQAIQSVWQQVHAQHCADLRGQGEEGGQEELCRANPGQQDLQEGGQHMSETLSQDLSDHAHW